MQRSELQRTSRRTPGQPKALAPDAAHALRDLCTALHTSTRATEALAEAMQTRRARWMSIRASEASKNPAELQGMATRCGEANQAVTQCSDRLTDILGLPRGAGAARIGRRLPPGPAQTLRTTADAARKAGTRLQVETRLGHRLLGFAQQAWTSLCQDVAKAAQPSHNAYDQTARIQGAATHTGTLLDGRM